MSNDPVYVDKRHYDALLRKFLCNKRELAELNASWTILKTKLKSIDDRVLDDIHKYDLQQASAYIDGVINTLIALGWDIEKMEEKRYVSPDHK